MDHKHVVKTNLTVQRRHWLGNVVCPTSGMGEVLVGGAARHPLQPSHLHVLLHHHHLLQATITSYSPLSPAVNSPPVGCPDGPDRCIHGVATGPTDFIPRWPAEPKAEPLKAAIDRLSFVWPTAWQLINIGPGELRMWEFSLSLILVPDLELGFIFTSLKHFFVGPLRGGKGGGWGWCNYRVIKGLAAFIVLHWFPLEQPFLLELKHLYDKTQFCRTSVCHQCVRSQITRVHSCPFTSVQCVHARKVL